MAKPDHRINKYGVNVADLQIGQWVEMEWLDAEDNKCLIVDIEQRAASYLGERCMDVLAIGLAGEWRACFGVNTQVKRIIGTLTVPTE